MLAQREQQVGSHLPLKRIWTYNAFDISYLGMSFPDNFVCACSSFSSETISCLSEMNVERAAAGLAAFKEATDATQVLPKTPGTERTITPATLWNEICKVIAKVSRFMCVLISRVLGDLVKQCSADPASHRRDSAFVWLFIIFCEGSRGKRRSQKITGNLRVLPRRE